MYKWLFVLFVIVVSCKNSSKDNATYKDTSDLKITAGTTYRPKARYDPVFDKIFNQDTLKIIWGSDVVGTTETDTLTRRDLKILKTDHPELFSAFPDDPDKAYAKIEYQEPSDEGFEFGSEAGRDSYYLFYSYFLKMRNGEKKYAGLRDTLKQIFRRINGINDGLVAGGTYFGHQHKRIEGYVEYAIFCYAYDKDDQNQDNYNINAQKEYFIKTLKQMVTDELNNNNEYWGAEREKTKIKMLNMIDEIGKLISSNKFILKQTQGFQYEHY